MRLAERIEYSQPVLYSHFRGKREIIGAVALEGATEMAAALRTATSAADGPRIRVTALARAYLSFAEHNPAVYDAMFQLDGGLAFAHEDTPEPLKDAFAALLESLGEVAGDGVHPALFTEVFWAGLHGLATLTRRDGSRQRTPSAGWNCWWTGSPWSDTPSRRARSRGPMTPPLACGIAFGHSRPHGAAADRRALYPRR